MYALTARQRAIVLDSVDGQLASEPTLETISLSTNPRFIEIIEKSRASLARDGGISSEEMRRRLGLSKPASGE